MRLIQKDIFIVTKTSDPEIWNKTDQVKRVLCKNALDYRLLDFDDEDDTQELNEKNIKSIVLPVVYILENDEKFICIGNLEQITFMSNNKQLNGKCRYFV